MNWPPLPALHGHWAAISDEEAAVLLAQLEALRKSSSQTPLSTSHDLLAMRTIDLPFYADRVLIEALLASKDQEQKAILSFVLPKVGDTGDDNGHSDALVVLDGTSVPIHGLNASVPISLGGAAQALAYLRFFCGFLWGDDGGFWAVERIQDLPWSGDADQGLKTAAAADLRPLEIESETQDAFRAKGSVLYDRHIYHAEFEIEKEGIIQMFHDDPISKKELPVLADHREGPFRLID